MKKVEKLETKVKNLDTICGLREKKLMEWKGEIAAHKDGMKQMQAAIDEFVPDPEDWETFDCPASGVVDGINRLYEMWKKAEDYQAVVEERVQKQYKDSIAGHAKEREDWKKALTHEEHARAKLKKELEEKVKQAHRRPRMVDKGVRALPCPEVCSTLTQTDVAEVKGIKRVTW